MPVVDSYEHAVILQEKEPHKPKMPIEDEDHLVIVSYARFDEDDIYDDAIRAGMSEEAADYAGRYEELEVAVKVERRTGKVVELQILNNL